MRMQGAEVLLNGPLYRCLGSWILGCPLSGRWLLLFGIEIN